MGKRIVLLVLFLVLSGALWALRPVVHHQEEIVTVAMVIDGDTIDLVDGRRVRLLGVNAPDKGELGYQEARERLRNLVEGRSVVLVHEGERDRYGRLLAWLYLENGTSVNLLLVREGLARPYTEDLGPGEAREIMAAWEKAVREGRGLWRENSTDPCAPCLGIEKVVWDPPGSDCENPNGEVVYIRNGCEHACNISGWVLGDESTIHRLVFGNTVIPGGGVLRVHSGCGTPNSTDTYWCPKEECKAIWNNNGDVAWLWDSQGRVVDWVLVGG